MSFKRTAHFLTYLGALPFYVLLIALFSSLEWPVWRSEVVKIYFGYSAIILSFITGIQWGLLIKKDDQPPVALFFLISTNIVALLSWVFLFVGNIDLKIVAYLSLYIYQLFVDKRLLRYQMIPEWFYALRLRITLIVGLQYVFHLIFIGIIVLSVY